jgi:phosphatidylglycerophosphate synthase
MEFPREQVIVVADAPEALVELCGISLLERLLRTLQRLGYRQATVLSDSSRAIATHLAGESWAREDLALTILPRGAGAVTPGQLLESFSSREDSAESILVMPAAVHCDGRLLRALADAKKPAVLVDRSAAGQTGLLCGPALLDLGWLSSHEPDTPLLDLLVQEAHAGTIAVVDVVDQPTYVPDMRRHLPLLCFPAPPPAQRRTAERLLLDSAQKGTLDIPARVHAPIETWLISFLCRTRLKPMHITIFGLLLSGCVTIQFALGWLWSGTLCAMAVGIVDGLDGKQARVKVETTPLGAWEHEMDYLLELSWWAALAYHFVSTGQLPNAYGLLVLLVTSDLIDRTAKMIVKRRTGRHLDDVTPIDRLFRLIGGRRNIYVWIFAAGLALGAPDQAFVGLCWWGAISAAVYVLRALWIIRHRRSA